MNAVSTEKLSKRYGRHEALRGIDLIVPEGSLFGFLGPNGAGKSTAIRIMMGLLRSTSGAARVLGRDAWRDGPRLRRDIGYLPGDVRFYESYTGGRVLSFLNSARGGRDGDELRRLADKFELDLSRRVRAYSRGMKQKLGLIAALMHRPRLLILDEPTTGLDPLMRQALFDELRAASAEERTVLFSSHTLAEVETLCSDVAVVRNGLLIEQDRVDVLRQRALRHVEVVFRDGHPDVPPPEGFRVERRTDDRLEGAWIGAVDPLLRWLASASVRDVSISRPRLEDLFLAYYSDVAEERS